MRELQGAFVFTDIEGSTRLWLDSPNEALAILTLHDDLIERAFRSHGGEVRKNTGDGVLAIFSDPLDAVGGALQAQRSLADKASALGVASSVRMAIHWGKANEREGDLFGLDIHLCQRIMSVGTGGQVLLSESAARTVAGHLPPTVKVIDIGRRRLKGLDEPERVYRLTGGSLHQEAVPAPQAEPWPGNIPEEATSFIGRERELADLLRLFDETRILTITGEGGVGKTRLAAALAQQVGDRFVDGTWILELEQMSGPEDLLSTAGEVLGLQIGDSSTALATQLAGRELLLILDGCEKLSDEAARLASDLVKRSARSKVLATSRHRLGAAGELLFRSPPLQVPPPTEDIEEAASFDAITLFAARASAAKPGFRLTSSNFREVAELCRTLDGVPLAVELAAARVSSMTPSEITGFLTSVAHDYSILESVLSWSVDILDSAERKAFVGTAVFRSPFDAAAASAVLDIPDALPLLAALVDKSLLRRNPSGRFRALEPVRAYAHRLLEETGGLRDTRNRHARHFGQLGVRATATRMIAPESPLEMLGDVADDLNDAHDYSMELGDGRLALELAVAAAAIFKQRGHARSGIKRLEDSIALGGPEDLIAQAHMNAGDLAIDVGAFPAAVEHLGRALDFSTRLGDLRQRAWAIARLASIPHKQGDIPEATRRLEEARTAAEQAKDDHILAHVLASLALIHNDQGHGTEATAVADEAIRAATSSGDPYALADVLLTMGELELDHGDVGTARVRFREAMELADRVGLGDVSAWALGYLGRAALISGDPREAVAFAKDAVGVFDRAGSALGRPWAMRHLAIGRWQMGDTTEGLRIVTEAMPEALGFVRPEALMLAEAKGWMLSTLDPLGAARTLGATETLAKSMRLVLPEWERSLRDRAIESLREQLGESTFHEAYRSGSEIELDRL